MKRIPFSQVLKTAAIDIRREYDRLYGMFCVQKFQDMVGAGSSLKDYCATYFVRLPFRGTCVSLDDFDDFYGYSFEKNPSTFDIEYLVSFCEYSYNLAIYNQNTIYGGGIVGIGDPMQFYVQQVLTVIETIGYMPNNQNGITDFVPKDQAAISAAEIVDPALSYRIIEYNHHSMKGDLERKKATLIALADKLEPKRAKLKQVSGSLESDLFYLLNSVNVRHNFFSILKESNITQSRLSLDMFRAVTEKFFIEYHQDLSAIPPLANTLVQFCCHSLSNQNPEHYVCCQKAKVSSNKLVVDFEVNSSKIASDIAEAIDRSVEYSVIGELLQPLVCLSKDSYSELFEKMELTSGQKKTLGTTAVRIDYYFNPDTYEIKETDVSELSIRKQIAKICAAAGVLPGTYERRDATEIVRKIQESVVSHLEQAIRTLERDRLHILLLSALATEQLSVNLNRTGATLTEDIEEGERIKSLEKSTQLSEKAKMRKSALLYLIETNLYLVNERKEEAIDSSKLSELLSFAKWIIYLQNSSDLCFHTDSDTKLIVEDDYRIDVELGENYSQTFEKESQRRIIAEPFNLRGDNTDRDFFEKVANAFYEDLGVHFKVLESVLHHLSDSSFSHDNVEFDEIAPNVIKAKATDVLNDYLSFVVENVPVEDVKSAYDFLTIVPGQLKTICDTTHPILPIWEREKRNHCFAVRPIYMSNNDYIYSPIIMEEVRKRWIEGFLQFYPPFEIGLERTCTALYAWKNNYEHLFSSEVEVLLKESGCEYAKHDVDLRREDRRGNHPTIDVLGDYDVIGLNTTQKRIFIIECKVLQPIGSVFEHSNQQKRFFTKEKFDEKFQKRIDYFSKVAMSFFANHGYDTEGFTINPYMVVNKVFSSYYKHVQFPIVTFDELKREIQL